MAWNGKDKILSGAHGDVQERGFTLNVEGHEVPGVYWQPAEVNAERVVALGHGGTTHKRIDYILEVAQLLAAKGIASMAIDGPGHGERVERWEHQPERFQEMWLAGGGTATVLTDWHAALNFVEAEFGSRPTGWWGLSMGTMMGLPVCASEPRIKVAVLGLMGLNWGPNKDDLGNFASQLSIPVRFLVQWDDEIVPRQVCLDLFGELGSERKTLHANPGLHSAVPAVEVAESVAYLDKYLA